MAEKKFFVDINLQGSALTNAKIGTNSGIGSTEGAFGYDSASHRLQYFNGSATQNVANLSDISAVTGGLIFQGGYDPTTDTPDITDGSALKGYFWAATAAGTFLGESVQVGDSIVAKVDNAGATIADWLILQGNIVIATDSVDGISRLATQTEANDGTEGGAVVITPATLQGKIDAQITPEISSKLPLAGGTMSGTLNMGNNTIDDVNNIRINAVPTDGKDATRKSYVDEQVATALPLAGGTMSGAIDMGTNWVSNAVLSNGSLSSDLDADNNRVVNLPLPFFEHEATNKTYVDGAASTAQSNAEATASADATTKANAAESNANAYTDTAISQEVTDRNNAILAQSFSGLITTADWTLSDGVYSKTITHNLGGLFTFTAFYNGEVAEFKGAYDNNTLTLTSNIEPTSNTVVNIIKAGGNL